MNNWDDEEVNNLLIRCLEHQSETIKLSAFSLLAQNNALPKDKLEFILQDGTVLNRISLLRILIKNDIILPQSLMDKLAVDSSSAIREVTKEFYMPHRTTPNVKDTYDEELIIGQTIKLPHSDWMWVKDPQDKGLRDSWNKSDFTSKQYENIEIGKFWPEYIGIAWYQKHFKLPPAPKKKPLACELHFGAVDEECWVWVNGIFAGSHAVGLGGWDVPFNIDVTNNLKWGKDNIITVRVFNDNMAGGIWKPIVLNLYYWH
jgi:hypothetical protein